jgi:F0F1-type ATP synthase assembly protein I
MNQDKKDVQNALVMVFEFSINMLVPIMLCTLIGVWLSNKTGINWLVVPFFFIGALAGYTNIYKMVKRFLKDKPENGKKDANKENHVKKIK